MAAPEQVSSSQPSSLLASSLPSHMTSHVTCLSTWPRWPPEASPPGHCTLTASCGPCCHLAGGPTLGCKQQTGEIKVNSWCTGFILTHWGRDKMAAISQMTTFKLIFVNENVRISIKISLKFVSWGPINNIPALVQIMAWRRPGDKPLPEPRVGSLLMHICVTRPQWVNDRRHKTYLHY